MSEVDEADDEDDDLSSGRQSRIEELARKIMEEKTQLAELEKNNKILQQKLSRDPINLNAELDTVSERSEVEDDESLRLANQSGKNVLSGIKIHISIMYERKNVHFSNIR